MEFTSIKQTLIGFTVFLTILALGSCGVAENADPSGGEAIAFQQDIENATTVPNFATAKSPLTREVLEPLGANAGATLEKRYVTESGAGSRTGRSWADAWAAVNLRSAITNITDATANRVYLVMVAGGTYKPTYGNPGNRSISFSMTNHVAIMGGFDPAGGWDRTGTTIFDGDIGNGDQSRHVFFHDSRTLDNAHLYGVMIINGRAGGAGTDNQGGGMHNNGSSPNLTEVVFRSNEAYIGGGMYNNSSSPVLTKVVFSEGFVNDSGGGMYNGGGSSPVLTEVVFSDNFATSAGGGMYNTASSPVLTNVVFSRNTASRREGGGMYNTASSPVLTRVVFSDNGANIGGGGMYNSTSSPMLTRVMFSNNGANVDGGGMYNSSSSPVMIGAVFRNNIAANGGGMWNDNDNGPGPLIVNTIFSANTLYGSGSGPDIAVSHGGVNPGAETIRIAGSVLGIGLAQPVNAIVSYNGTAALNISNRSLANGAVNFGAEATLTINGVNFAYPTITGGSSAIDIGLYVRKHVNGSTTTYYFSETGTGISWYTGFTSTGGLDGAAENLPTTGTIEDLTATDIAGNPPNGRPDAGVYEVQ